MRMVRANPNVCFEIDDMESMANRCSVIAWGTYQELSGEEASRAMQLLIERLSPLIASETSPAPTRTGQRVLKRIEEMLPARRRSFRIQRQEKTGRFEKR